MDYSKSRADYIGIWSGQNGFWPLKNSGSQIGENKSNLARSVNIINAINKHLYWKLFSCFMKQFLLYNLKIRLTLFIIFIEINQNFCKLIIWITYNMP